MRDINKLIAESTKKQILGEAVAKQQQPLDGFQIDKLKGALQSAAKKLQDALKSIPGVNEQYIVDCFKIYEHLNNIPSGHKLLASSKQAAPVKEDIKVSQDIDAKRLTDVAGAAQKAGTDVTVVKENHDPTEKYYKNAVLEVRTYANDQQEALGKSRMFLAHLNSEHTDKKATMSQPVGHAGNPMTDAGDSAYKFRVKVRVYADGQGDYLQSAWDFCHHLNQTHGDKFQCSPVSISKTPIMDDTQYMSEPDPDSAMLPQLHEGEVYVPKVLNDYAKTNGMAIHATAGHAIGNKQGYMLKKDGEVFAKLIPSTTGFTLEYDGNNTEVRTAGEAVNILRKPVAAKYEIVKEMKAVELKQKLGFIS